MSICKSLLLVVLTLVLSNIVNASTKLQIVNEDMLSTMDRNDALGTRRFVIKSKFTKQVIVENPSRAFKAPYKNVFLQNEYVVICYQDCSKKQPKVYKDRKGNYSFKFKKKAVNKRKNMKKLKLGNTYYWATQVYKVLKEKGLYEQNRRLVYIVDDEIKNVGTGKHLHDNAFFSHEDWRIHLLKAKAKVFSRINGKKDAALDPTVIAHETGHAVFQEIIYNNLNTNSEHHEGFADFISYLVTGQPLTMPVFMGKNILGEPRDLTKDNTYKCRDILTTYLSLKNEEAKKKQIGFYASCIEEHNVGEVIASFLYKFRNLFSNKDRADKIIFNAYKKFGKFPGSEIGTIYPALLTAIKENLNYYELAINKTTEIWKKSRLDEAPSNTTLADTKSLKAQLGEKILNEQFKSLKGVNQLTYKFKITEQYPKGLDHDWGVHKTESYLEYKKAFLIKEYQMMWMNIEYQSKSARESFWVLSDLVTRKIIHALDESFQDMNFEDSSMSNIDVTRIASLLKTSLLITSGNIDTEEMNEDKSRLGKVINVPLNGKSYSGKLYKTKLSKLFDEGGKLLKSLSFETIDQTNFITKGILGEYLPGNKELVTGLTYTYRSGFIKKIQLVGTNSAK